MAEKSSSDEKVWIIGFFVVLALFMAVPLAVAIAVFWVSSPYLGRRDYWVLLGVGCLGWGLNLRGNLIGYYQFVADVVSRDFGFGSIPWIALLAAVCTFVGLIGVVSASSIATKRLPAKVQATLKRGSGAVPVTGQPIIPTAETKSKLAPAAPFGGTLIDATAHSIEAAEERGKRTFPLGIGVTGELVKLNEAEVGTHGVILGATGSGKSKTIEGLAGGLLDLGWSGMILDLKEDTAPGGLRDWCRAYANAHSIPYQELRLSDPDSPFWFNSLTGMGPDEIRDTILTLSDFDDAYWQALNKELLGQAVNLVVWANQADPVNFPEPTMYDIGKLLSTGNLERATKKHRAVVLAAMPHVTKEDFRVLENPSQDQQKSAVGFGSKLTLIYDTQAGRTVLRPGADNQRRQVDVTARGITYIGLDSQGKADLTSVISSSVLQRMSVYAAQRVTGLVSAAGEDDRRFLIVDEANWVNRTIVQNLLSRARSAKIAMFLCTQGPKDWIDEKGDDWGKLTQNINAAIIMRQGEPKSAELCAEFIGKHKVTQSSRSKRIANTMVFGEVALRDADGRLVESETEREGEDFIVGPEELRNMGVGEAVLKIGVPNRIQWLRVSLRDPNASPRRGF